MAYTVFISSTSKDLERYREQAAAVAKKNGFAVTMSEDWSPSGQPSLVVCREEVDKADLVIAIVAHRYGWVPDPAGAKSVTWLECEHAGPGKVLAFLVDPEYEWPKELYEDYRLTEEKGLPARRFNALRKEVARNETKLNEFKAELSRNIRGHFKDVAGFREMVLKALLEWKAKHGVAHRGDPEAILKWLEEDTRTIRITGLTTKRAEPYFIPIDEIYIPLTTLGSRDLEQKQVALEKALTERKVVIVGDAGSGKSTFLRRVAFELCRNPRGSFLPADDRRFPILIRVADFAKMLATDTTPKLADSAEWVAHFLEKQSQAYGWGADEAFFQHKLQQEHCLVMFDGLDEAPDTKMRERVARIFERATAAFQRCDFLVSTRPQTNVGESVLKDFHALRILPLQMPEIQAFFDHFAKALALNETETKRFKGELQGALKRRGEIRELAENAVMLTALAVLQHNDQRLPEYRVDLYGSILGWLAAAKQHKEGHPGPAECLKAMRRLALFMQDGKDGKRLVQVKLRAAAEYLAAEFGDDVEARERLLQKETQDSGIVSAVGNDLKFWHLSFQEYLAALEIAGLPDQKQIERVVESGKLYHPEWRETMRLLGGVLFKQGEEKIAGLFEAILERLGERPSLKNEARCAALLGVMMRDLGRMGYQPKMPAYERTVMSAMGIFEVGSEGIDLRTRIEAADALGQVGDPRLEEENWVTIPAGTFWMGAQSKRKKGRNYDPEARGDEAPVHEVTLAAFRIGKYPVTVQEFAAFIADGGYAKPELWKAGGPGEYTEPDDWEKQIGYPSRPVVGVSWFEASAYCYWKGGRLPTEAEWERAARGPDGARYPWGNEPALDAKRANYGESEAGSATPVGLFPLGNSVEGVCDLLGNVDEWCQDWYGLYGAASEEKSTKVLRGGSWDNSPQFVRASSRFRDVPSNRDVLIGFRCAGELSL
jgi:formylglycine-generating enzyme required for sulfatase activity